jgi:hypothetical protein
VAKIGDNTVASATLHAVSLIGAVTGTTVRGNTLSGSGSSAVDVSRVTTGRIPDVRVNDTGGWQRVITKDGALSTVMHPLTLVWIGIAALILGSRPIARRARRAPQQPYLEKPTRSEATAGISVEQRVAIEAILALEGRPAGWEDVQQPPAPVVPAVAAPTRRYPTEPGQVLERRAWSDRSVRSEPAMVEFTAPDPAGHGWTTPQYVDLRDDVQPSVEWAVDDLTARSKAVPTPSGMTLTAVPHDSGPISGLGHVTGEKAWFDAGAPGESSNADWLRRMGRGQ